MLDKHTQGDVIIFASLVYSLWHSRNKLIFEDQDIPMQIVIESAMKVLSQFQQANSKLHPLHIQPSVAPVRFWIAPPDGVFKLNTDLAFKDGANWGVGVVVRDHEGFVLGAASWQKQCGAEVRVAEALGLCLGLQFALDMGIIF
ncbi:uncharacterized protein LOC109810168 [Cajanus cajan]|nr:uncharacterized protein LOC109810168 [Cajanus cajan]